MSGVKYTHAWAQGSDDGRFRWILGRVWQMGPTMHFVMLNPSTADAEHDDPTIRKCVGFADRHGCGRIVVTNLFSFRATDPTQLHAALRIASNELDVIGRETDAHIRDEARFAEFNVVAWGSHARHPLIRARAAQVLRNVRWEAKGGLLALKLSPDGTPHHPLMLPYAAHLVSVPDPEARA